MKRGVATRFYVHMTAFTLVVLYLNKKPFLVLSTTTGLLVYQLENLTAKPWLVGLIPTHDKNCDDHVHLYYVCVLFIYNIYFELF